jgi:E3 ubiquitin-protein ligase DOA10
MMEDGEEEENDDNCRHMFPEYNDTAMEESEEEEECDERASLEPADDLSRVISNAKRDYETEKERLQFEQMLQDHKKCCTQIVKMARKSWIAHWNC